MITSFAGGLRAARHRASALALLVGISHALGCRGTTPSTFSGYETRTFAPTKDLQAFVVAVELLPGDPADATRAQVVSAFTRLAAALRETGGAKLEAAAERIGVLTQHLATADVRSGADSDVTRAALGEAVDALEYLDDSQATRTRDAAARSAARFDPTRPMLAQVATVRATLAHVANVLLAARDLPLSADPRATSKPAREAAGADGVPQIDDARSASERVAVLAAASASGMRDALATALEAFAAALEVGAGHAAGERLASIRANAARIRSADALGPDATAPAKAALTAALDVLDDATARPRRQAVGDLIARGRAAVNALDAASFLSFQRAPLQEACRIVADVLVFTANASPATARRAQDR